jgi:tetratricopeptide (TPR) repeat protein
VLALATTLWLAADCALVSYDCALERVGRREFSAAVGLLEQLHAARPQDLKTANLLGIALTGAGRKDAANARFREVLAIDPGFTPSRKNLAINEFDSGRLAEARGHLEAVLRLAPGDEISNLYLAEIHFKEHRPAAALPHYEKSGERWAQNPEWVLHYGQCLLDAQRPKLAVATLERLGERDAALLFEAGVALGRARAHAEAARFFAKARAGYRDPYAALYNQTLMLIEAADHAEAARIAEAQFAAGNAPAELYNLAARAYLGAGRLQEAYDALRTAVRLEPTAILNYVDLAMICLEHENLDLGMEIADVGLRQRPDSWLLHLQKGVLLAMKSEFGKAEDEFESARRLAPPEQAVPYAALSMVWMQSGQADKAVEVLRAETARRPGDSVVPYLLAVALQRSGIDPESAGGAEAVAALRASIAAKPGFAPSRSELGRLLLRRGDTEGAIRELEKAAALDPSRTATLYNLAQAYRKQGDRDKASQLLARVSKLNDAERGDADGELKRVVLRLVREGAATQ